MLFFANGSYLVKSVVVGGVKVGVLIGQTFFPVVEDWRHSLRAVIAEELDDLIFLREFAPWGEKTLIKNTTSTEIAAAAKNYDFYIPWSFAGLTQDSIYNAMKQGEEQNLYWSESRVYSPEIREWLTKDPLVAFAPESLLDKPGNWHPTRYAGNDPVNFVDPSGYAVIVHARELNFGGVLGQVGAHSYIEVTKSNGSVVQISGSGRPGSKLEINIGSKVDTTTGFEKTASLEITPPKNMPQDQWEDAVINAGKSVQNEWSGKFEYATFGGDRRKDANCHNVTREVLDRVGGQGNQLNDFDPPGANPGLNN